MACTAWLSGRRVPTVSGRGSGRADRGMWPANLCALIAWVGREDWSALLRIALFLLLVLLLAVAAALVVLLLLDPHHLTIVVDAGPP
jgi:hypothetical protein